MSITTSRLNLEEYLNRLDESDKHYELVAGNLSEMPPESPLNAEIAIKLLLIFAQLVPTTRCLRCKDTEIVVSGSRTTVRLPDLMVLTEELASILYDSGRSTIMPDMPPPALVVEVVSPGKANQDRAASLKTIVAVLGVSPQEAELPSVARRDIEPCSCSDCIKKQSEYAARGIMEY